MWTRFKKWLKESGTTYSVTDNRHPYYKQEVIDVLNPFDLEENDHLLARIYRNDFWDGLSDTYDILTGTHYFISPGQKGRKGLLDILIFPVIARRVGEYENPITLIFVAMPLIFARGIIAGCLTLVLSPFVAIVSAIFQPKVNKLREAVKTLRSISGEPLVANNNFWKTMNVHDRFHALIINNQESGQPQELQIIIPQHYHDRIIRIAITEQNYAGLKALQELNMCRKDQASCDAINEALKYLKYLTSKPKIIKEVEKQMDVSLGVGGDTGSILNSLILAYADTATDKQHQLADKQIKASQLAWEKNYKEPYNEILRTQNPAASVVAEPPLPPAQQPVAHIDKGSVRPLVLDDNYFSSNELKLSC